jgi:hypothetical protein
MVPGKDGAIVRSASDAASGQIVWSDEEKNTDRGKLFEKE